MARRLIISLTGANNFTADLGSSVSVPSGMVPRVSRVDVRGLFSDTTFLRIFEASSAINLITTASNLTAGTPGIYVPTLPGMRDFTWTPSYDGYLGPTSSFPQVLTINTVDDTGTDAIFDKIVIWIDFSA